MQKKRNNEAWLKDLRAEGAAKEAALEDLHAILLRVLPAALSRWLPSSSSHFETFIEDIAQETLLRVMDKLDSFAGRSKFTTWVYKIGVNIGLGQLRLRKWQETSLDKLEEGNEPDEMPSRRFASDDPSPEISLERKNIMAQVEKIMKEELTPRQREVMMAMAVHGKPMNVVAEEFGTNRNALYKMMHDARLRLKQRLEREGTSAVDLLAVFGQ